MSVTVTLQQLADTLARYRFAYLLTICDDGRARVVTASTTVADETLLVTGLGRKTRGNLATRPSATLLWPPADPDGYSLIVDGFAELRGDQLAITPTRAVLHRPARSRTVPAQAVPAQAVPAQTVPAQTTPANGGCASDCVDLPVSAGSGTG